MVIDNHDCSCGSGCSRVGQFHQHAQPNWVDHCSCMPRGSGDLLHRQQADFLNMPRSSARRDSTFQQPGPARPVCFTVIDVLSSRCAAAPLRPAPLRCCAAPPLHPVWISCPRRGISFLWRRTPIGSLPARDFLHRLTDSILAPQELARVRPTPPPPPPHSSSTPCRTRARGALRPRRPRVAAPSARVRRQRQRRRSAPARKRRQAATATLPWLLRCETYSYRCILPTLLPYHPALSLRALRMLAPLLYFFAFPCCT
jgi:hypothetical protein